jgi:hypothetical protein
MARVAKCLRSPDARTALARGMRAPLHLRLLLCMPNDLLMTARWKNGGGETQVNGVDGVRSLGTGPYTPSSPPPTRSQSERCRKVKVARYTVLCMSSKSAVEY